MEFEREYNDYVEPIKNNSYYFDDLDAIRRRSDELAGIKNSDNYVVGWLASILAAIVLKSILKAWWLEIIGVIACIVIFILGSCLADNFITEPKRKRAERIFNLRKESILKKRIREDCDRELNDLRNQFENSTNEHVGLLYDHIWSDHSGNDISADDVTFNIKQYHNLRDDYHRISHDIRHYISQQKEILQKYKYFEERLLVDIYCDPDIAKKFEYR